MGRDESKVHSTGYTLKENGNSIHWELNSTHERFKKKPSICAKKEYETGNNQTEGINQQNRNKKNSTINETKKFVLEKIKKKNQYPN